MKNIRVVLISLFVLAGFFIAFRSAQASPAGAPVGLLSADQPGFGAAGGSLALAPVSPPSRSELPAEPLGGLPVRSYDTDAIGDLSLSISDSPDPVLLGQDLTYTVVVSNDPAGETIANAVLTDTLPASVTFVSATPAQGSCNNITPGVVCNLGSMAGGSSVQVVIVVTTTAIGSITNNVEALPALPDTDSNTANNQASASTTVESANLSVSVTDSPDPVYAGNVLQYTVSVSNAGPSIAQSVSLVHVVPTGLTNISASPGAPTCNVSGQQVTCALGALASGGSIPVTISALVPAGFAAGDIGSTSTVSSTTLDPSSANNTDPETTTVQTRVDLSVTNTDSPDPVYVGSTVQYTLQVTNAGPSNATSVSLVDTLASGLTNISSVPGAPTCNVSGQQVTCSLGTLAPSGTSQVIVSALVPTSFTPGSFGNTVTVSSPVTDLNSLDNTAPTTTTARALANLALALRVSNPTPLYGATIAYTVTVTNSGPSAATGVTVQDALPAGLTYGSHGVSQGSYASATGIWTVGTIASGSSAWLRLNVTVNTTGSYSNYAQVLASGVDDPNSNPGNSSTNEDDDDTLAVVPVPTADLSLGLTVSRASPLMGSTIAYTVTLTNGGPNSATGVVVTDQLPAGYTFGSFTATQGTYAGGVWTVGTLANGAVARLRLNATVNTTGSYSNYAQVTASPVADPDSIPNNASTTEDDDDTLATTPVPGADLSLALRVSNTSPLIGGTIAYTVTVTNAGPSQATGVSVVDLLPNGFAYGSYALSQGTYTSGTGVWSVGNINSGASAWLRLNATVNTGGSYSNYAQVTVSPVADPDSTPNNASTTEDDDDTLAITPAATSDLSLGLTVSNASPLMGSTIAYTVTLTNGGPSAVTNATVTDLLPAGYTYVSYSATQGTYVNTSGLWTVGTLANGAVARLRLNATVNTTGSYSNYAQVTTSTSGDPDSTPGNGSTTEDDDDTLATTPVPAADLSLGLTVSNAAPLYGSTIAYTVTVTNSGPSAATSVSVLDALPTGFTYVSNAFSQGSYASATGIWTIGSIASGGSAWLRLNATVNTSGNYSNYAQVLTSPLADPDSSPGNSSTTEDDDDTLAVVPAATADLSLGLTVSNATPLVGSTIAYTVTVTNGGPSSATNVAVTDLLPAGYAFVSYTATQGTYVNTTGVWTVGTLANAGVARLRLNAVVNPAGSYSNYAQVTAATEADPDSIPNNASTTEDDDDTLATVPVAGADLSLALTVSNATPLVGSTLAYTVTVTNAGPGAPTGVAVTDLLPAGYTFVSYTATQGTYVNTTGVWTVGTLANAGVARLRLNATVNAAGSYSNYAQVTASGLGDPDSIPNNNSTTEDDDDTLATVPVAGADLSLALTVSNASPLMGSTIAYTVTVTNSGPAAASAVAVTDLLPAGYTFVSYTATQGTYVNTTGVWTVGALANAGVARLRMNATVNTAGSYSNYAQVTASTPGDPDSIPGNSSTTEDDDDTLATVPVIAADLSLGLTVSNAAPLLSSTIAYTVTLTNGGPSPATSVLVSDLLPNGYTFVSYVATQGTYANNTGIWTVGTLANAAVARLRLNVTVNTAGIYSNYAQVLSSVVADPDSIPGNSSTTEDDDDTLATVPVPAAALSITKVASGNPIVAGTPLTYTLSVVNAGPSAATSLVVTDTLPANVTYSSYGLTTGWACTLATGNRLVCTRASLAASANTTITIGTRVLSGATGSLSNVAVVRSAVADPLLTDNTFTLATTVSQTADLSVVKTGTPNPVAEGQPLVYRMVVRNNGPSDAAAVTLSDALPTARVTYGSWASTQGTCTWTSPNLSCALGSITSGSVVTVTLNTTARLVGDSLPKNATNTVTVSSTTTDPTTPNSASITTRVSPAANLSINLTSSVSTIQTGNPLTYTLTVTNGGPSTASSVVVTDTLPAELTYVSSSRTPLATSPRVIWNVGNLNMGQSTSFTMVVNVNSRTQDLVNTAAVGSASSMDVVLPNQDDVTVRAEDNVVPTAAWRLPTTADQTFMVLGEDVLLEVLAEDNVAISYVRFYRWDAIKLIYVDIANVTTPVTCQADPDRQCYQYLFDTSVLNPNWNEVRARSYDTTNNPSVYSRILLYYNPIRIYLPYMHR